MRTLRSRARMVMAGLALGVAVVPAVPLTVAPAAAQNFFDFFFGGRRHSAPPPSPRSYGDPNADNDGGSRYGSRRERVSRGDGGPAVAYCVRLCDGRYFPIQRSGDADPAQVCSAFCPASRTRIFSGSAIDEARARDGTRYASLANAFVYRERVVDGCTCNGKDAFGLVGMKPADDRTLQPGDVVATNQGFVAYTGGRRQAEFTPIARAGASAELRRRLALTGIVPAPGQQQPPQSADDSDSGGTVGRSVQRERHRSRR